MDDALANPLSAAADYDAAAPEAFLGAVPAKWCVALLCDREVRPLQLMCAKNLRATLRRRLGSPDDGSEHVATKRIDYRDLVRSVRWHRVDSELEMDVAYVNVARVAFPADWRRLVPDRSAHFVAIDADAAVPDFVRLDAPATSGLTFGPFSDKAKADRWIDSLRDAFDLCRYRNILAQTPNGRACAYKQMGKCPAPCDGSIPMEAYREQVRAAIATAIDPRPQIDVLTATMKRYAADLEFEAAGRTKGRLSAIESLRAGSLQHVRPVAAFQFVSIQPGPRKKTAKVFLLNAVGIAEVGGILTEQGGFGDVARAIESAEVKASGWPSDLWLGTACHHLISNRSAARFVERDYFNEETFATMTKAAMRVETKGDDAEPLRETTMQGV